MARSAKLTSIEAVRDMAIALGTFGEEALAALDELDMNLRRAIEWIDQDRKNFWSHELRQGAERLSEARVELEKAMTYRKMSDYTPACREERILVDRAKRRMQTAEEKHHVLPHWSHKIHHAVQELNGRQTQLASWLRGDLPKAIGVLKQMALTLERYAAVAGGVPQKDAPQKASAAQDEEEASEEQTVEVNETEEPENEDMGSTHAGGETSPSDERPGSDQGENQ